MCGGLPGELRRALRRCSNLARRALLACVLPLAAAADLFLELLIEYLNFDADAADKVLRRLVQFVLLPWAVWLFGSVLLEVNRAAPAFLPAGARHEILLEYGWIAMAKAAADCLGTLLLLVGMLLHKILSCYLAFWVLWPWTAVLLTSVWLFGLWMGAD